ncbi:8.9 kDa basic protein [Bienertia sinuspersici]
MACLEMYNNTSSSPSSQSPPPPMSPRISFSNDFVESHNNSQHLLTSSRSEVAPASTDFEFSVTNYNNKLSSIPTTTATADELFFKGRLLPFKDNNNNGCNNAQMQRTLRDELLVDDDEEHQTHPHFGFSLKPPKSSSSNRWKGFLGLRKSHIGSKKVEKIDASTFDSGKRFSFGVEDPNLTKTSQDMMSGEGPSGSDMEMGI